MISLSKMQQFRLPTILGLSSVLFFLASPVLASFTVDELTIDQFKGRGCGMTLWKLSRKSSDHFVFFNGIEPNTMEISINGNLQKFTRIKGSGQQFYGQMTSQTFQNKNKKITVDVNVELGKKVDTELTSISKGTIRVKRDKDVVSFAVRGDAGC